MIDYRLECGLVSNVWENIAPDVLDRFGIKWRRGIFGNGPLDLVAGPGKMSFGLNNALVASRPDWMSTASGRYSPGHPNVWTRGGEAFRRNKRVRLRVGIDYGYRQLVLAHGAIAYYRLDRSGSAVNQAPDLAGASTTGAYAGGVTPFVDGAIPGDANLAVELDGVDGEITFTESILPSGSEHRWTFAAWIKTSTTATQEVVTLGSGADRASLGVNAGGQARALIHDGTSLELLPSGVAVDDGEWHFVVATYNEPDFRVFVDGQLAASTTSDPFTIGVAANLNIGRTVGGSDWFTGLIDEVSIYAYPLSESQVLEQYQAATFEVGYADMVLFNNPAGYWRLGEESGTIAVDETSGADGAYVGTVTQGANGALADGDTGVEVSNPTGPNTRDNRVDVTTGPALGTAFTLAGWVRFDSTGHKFWLSRGLPYLSRQNFAWRDSGSTQRTISFGADALDNGEVGYMVATHDGTTARVYINGNEVVSDNSFDTESVASGLWNFGAHTNTTVQSHDGLVDEVAMFDYALTATQVSALYAARVSELVKDAGRIYYPFLGSLESIEPTPGIDGEKAVACTAVDWMGELENSQPRLDVRFIDPSQSPPENFAESTQGAWFDLIAAVDQDTGEDNIVVGDGVVMIAFDDLGGRRDDGSKIARMIAETDLSLFYARGNDGTSQFGLQPLGGQTLEALPPSARATQAANPAAVFSAAELRDPDGIVVANRVVNDVIVKINPPRVDTTGVIATVNSPIPVKQGLVRETWLEHTNHSEGVGLPAGATGVITPVTPNDFLGNSKSDGSGVDRSSEVAVTATPMGARTLLQWSVTGSNNVWVRGPAGGTAGPQLRGESIVRDGEMSFRDLRHTSAARFGPSAVVINAAYNFFPEYAKAMAEAIADTYEELSNFPAIVRPQTAKAAVLRKALAVTIGSGVTVSESLAAVDEKTVIVYGEEGEISKGAYAVAWHVAPPLDTTAIDNVEFGT